MPSDWPKICGWERSRLGCSRAAARSSHCASWRVRTGSWLRMSCEGMRLKQAQQDSFAIGRPRPSEHAGHETTRASTSRHCPTTKVRGRVSIVRLDSRTFSKSPSIGYAPSEYRTKPWPQRAPMAGCFPLLGREQNDFRVDGTTDTSAPAPRSLCQRSCGSRHLPLSGDRRTDHLFPVTSLNSRTRVDAGCQNR